MKFVVGNWKMHPKTLVEAGRIVSALKKNLGKKTGKHQRIKVIVCPPALFIAPLIASAKKAAITLGAQNASLFDEGAYTGETSPLALAKIGATHVILGHSERRAMGEDDALIAQKVVRAVRNKLCVILCVGERMRDDSGAYFTEVAAELRGSLAGFPKSEMKRLIIAYEPIWAIGSKALHAEEADDFREMKIFIRKNLISRFGKRSGFTIPILYGGSVDEHNAQGFLREGAADGFLVGRASIDPKRFSEIIHVAAGVR